MEYEPADLALACFVGANNSRSTGRNASDYVRGLSKLPVEAERGRLGPRPYDLRQPSPVTSEQMVGEGVEIHARLPGLSAYMGHVDISALRGYPAHHAGAPGPGGNRMRRDTKTNIRRTKV